MSSLLELLNTGFMPHGHCFYWLPTLLWMFVLSDAGITLAYFSIPIGIYKVIKLSNLKSNKQVVRVFYLFAAFIFACGTTHLIKIITLWHPIYWISAYVNILTAIVSLTAAFLLFRTMHETSQYIRSKNEAENELETINANLQSARELFAYQNMAIEFLNETNDLLDTCTNEKEFSEVVITVAQKLTSAESGILYLIHNDSSYAELAASWGEIDSESVILDLDKCWAYRQYDIFPSSYIESFLTCDVAPLKNTEHTCFPMVGAGKILGLLQLRGIKKLKGNAARANLETLVKRAGLELMNLRLKENLTTLSIKDPLTGLYNRRYLEDVTGKELKRSERTGKNFGFIMLDIDNFKDINDQYGHIVGDDVLVKISDIISNTIRNQDVACRYGGEEFAVLLPETGEEGALLCAEKIRENIQRIEINANSNIKLHIRISCGISTYPENGRNIPDIINNADTALYTAKKTGKNKSILYQPGLSDTD